MDITKSTNEISKELREMAMVMFKLGDFRKQGVLEQAADRLDALESQHCQ